MALKDWKKHTLSEWEGSVYFSRTEGGGQGLITITYHKENIKPWEVAYGKVGSPKFKSFKTRPEAMKFAKDYMRKH